MKWLKALFKRSSPEIIFLVGLPGCGKSTFTKEKVNSGQWSDYSILSTDAFIESQAKIEMKTYDEVFHSTYPKAEEQFLEALELAVAKKKNIIIDRTNMSKKDRDLVMNKLTNDYKRKAIVFHVPLDVLKKRVNNRWTQTGKKITDEVMERIASTYTHPTKEEFNTITLSTHENSSN